MSASRKPLVQLFTDGACSGNPGPGGWAYILVRNGEGEEASGGEKQTTNNRMELLAVIRGLEALEEPSAVALYSDSQYVVYGLSQWMDGWKAKGWRRSGNSPVKNVELWQELDELRQVHQLDANWVRGHSDHPENNRCDELAVAAAERVRPPKSKKKARAEE